MNFIRMETESVKVDVKAMVLSQSPLLGFSSNVVISLNWENEEFLVDESDGSVTSLGSSPASSSSPLPNPQIFPKFRNFTPSYVYKRVNSRFHDPVLSRNISDEIVVEAQRSSSQNLPLVMGVLVTLTQKVYVVMPCRPAPSSTRDLETDICAVCLDNLSGSGSETKPNCELPDCHHRFHEECFVKWYLDRNNNSCPLCRQSIYE